MNRTQARDRLTGLGFSQPDAERMVTASRIIRVTGGQVSSGLSGNAEIGVFYHSGRYQVMARHRHPDPAPCMWPREHWASPWTEA